MENAKRRWAARLSVPLLLCNCKASATKIAPQLTATVPKSRLPNPKAHGNIEIGSRRTL